MEPRLKCEQKLCAGTDSAVDELDCLYCADMTDMEKVETKMADVELKEALPVIVKEVIYRNKLFQRERIRQHMDVPCHIHIVVTGAGTRIYSTYSKA